MKAFSLLFVAIVCSVNSYGALVHSYTFDGTDPYADSVGDADLTKYGTAGTITTNSEGFIHFSGTDSAANTVYLGGDALSQTYAPFVLSIWFRTANAEGQSKYSSIFSSNDGSNAGLQIHLYNGYFGVNMNGTHLNVLPLDQLTENEWHLVTLMQDPDDAADNQGQIWLDGTVYATNAGTFGALNSFRLGVNRSGKQGFEGDIAEVAIYDGVTWNGALQEEAYLAGPAIPEPAVVVLIAMTGATAIGVRRIFF